MKGFLKLLKYIYVYVPPITLIVVAFLYYFDQQFVYVQIAVVAAILAFWRSFFWSIIQKILGK